MTFQGGIRMKRHLKCFVIIACLVLALASSISCRSQADVLETKNFVFENCYSSINLVLPDGWTAYQGYSKYDKPDVMWGSYLNVSNEMKFSVKSDNGIEFAIFPSIITRNKDYRKLKYINDKSFNGIDCDKDIQCGDNHLFLSNPPTKGYVYVDDIVIMPLTISHWPKNGITKEIENFFASLHID